MPRNSKEYRSSVRLVGHGGGGGGDLFDGGLGSITVSSENSAKDDIYVVVRKKGDVERKKESRKND